MNRIKQIIAIVRMLAKMDERKLRLAAHYVERIDVSA